METQVKLSTEQYLQQVVSILNQEIESSRRFLATIQEERQALSEMDISALIRHTVAKEEIIAAIQERDADLQEVLQELGEDGGRNFARLGALDLHFRGPARQRYQILRREWADLREEILAGNVVNHRFIQESLTFLGDAIALFAGVDRQKNEGYKAAGTHRKAVSGPCVICREV